MKKLAVVLVLALLVALVPAVSPVAAQSNMPPLCSGFQLQNTSATQPAAVSVNFYKIGTNDGAPDYTFGVPDLAPNGSRSFYVPSYAGFSTVASGQYAVVVSSNQKLNSLVNEVTCNNGTPFVYASHSGVDAASAATELYLPFVMSRAFAEKWSAGISIQNAGTAAGDVKVEFFKTGVSTPVDTLTMTGLKQNETWYIDLNSGTYATALLNGFNGAAKVTSAQKMVAIVNYAPGNGSRAQSYNGTAAGGTKLYAPQVTKHYAAGNYTSGLTVYNPNGTEAPITVKYIRSGDTTATTTQTVTIAANSVWVQYLGSVAGLPDGFNGTAVVETTSANNLYGVASIDSAVGQAASVNMIPDSQAATVLSFPQIVRAAFGGYESGWQVVNNSGNALTLEVTYTRDTGVVTTETKTLAANSALTNYVGGAAGAALGTGWNGGLTVKVTAGAGKIVGQANFVAPASLGGDTQLMYNGFPTLP